MDNKKTGMWTTEEKEYLKEIVYGRHYEEIRELMIKKFGYDFSKGQIKSAVNRYKFNTGFTGRFEKGNVPVNKGTKGVNKPNKTSFKKGMKCINKREVGSERVNIYGYVEVKVAEPDKWAFKHKVVWEKHNRPIRKGEVIIFADRNRNNFDINNLILISNKQLIMLNRNKLIKNDADLTRVGITIANIYLKVKDINKQE